MTTKDFKRTLKDLVPPPELCQRIPAGKFTESALVWDGSLSLLSMPPKVLWTVIPRNCFFGENPIPAPTLAEILDAMRYFAFCVDCCARDGGTAGWRVGGDFPVKNGFPGQGEIKVCGNDLNPATAALNLWLNVIADLEISRNE